jgi:hypothetical protein
MRSRCTNRDVNTIVQREYKGVIRVIIQLTTDTDDVNEMQCANDAITRNTGMNAILYRHRVIASRIAHLIGHRTLDSRLATRWWPPSASAWNYHPRVPPRVDARRTLNLSALSLTLTLTLALH